MEESKRLCVAYAADDNYTKYLGISMLSLFQSNKDFTEIVVFVLDCGITNSNKKILISIAEKFGHIIHFLSMEVAVTGLNLNMGSKKISIASYARLFLSSVIPETYSRILYLDCDTIVRTSIADYWNMDLTGYMVAGVHDTVDRYYIKKIGLEEDDYYVNAGVILINLVGWREKHLEKQFMDFIRKNDGNVPHHDQGTINGVCMKRKRIVELKYNATSNIYCFSAKTIKRIYEMDHYYSQKELEEVRRNPAIIHFTGGPMGRPWEENCTHPMLEEYRRVTLESPWRDDPLLPDSRSFLVKTFAFFYKHMPIYLSEVIYRSTSWIIHIKE
ncbi:MAG: hypothetical protein K0S47_40 [Herbinix sp.]|jgi:lipopolysaccharide biosynthesis glycosyltransferase|nr:hypothetical protein [Herbinix sp.]